VTAVSFPARIAGIVRTPRRTLEAVADDPRWGGTLLLTFVVVLACQTALQLTEPGELALLDHIERMTLALGQEVDAVRYAELRALSEQGVWYAVLAAVTTGPVLAVGIAAVLFFVLGAPTGATVTFRHVLAVTAHAGVILALRQVCVTPLLYLRESLASPLTLAMLVPLIDGGSLAAHAFSAIDLFVVWWSVVLAIGIAVLYRRTAPRLWLAFMGVYAAVAVVMALAIAASERAA
jgi:hypothetical protein